MQQTKAPFRSDEVGSLLRPPRIKEARTWLETGEISTDHLRKAGRQKTYRDTTLYTTLSPCMMCSGTILQFGIPRVVVGEAKNFVGDIPFLESRGVTVTLMDDPGCKDVMHRFLAQPGGQALWHEDIMED